VGVSFVDISDDLIAYYFSILRRVIRLLDLVSVVCAFILLVSVALQSSLKTTVKIEANR